jgi:hypothetical protein
MGNPFMAMMTAGEGAALGNAMVARNLQGRKRSRLKKPAGAKTRMSA